MGPTAARVHEDAFFGREAPSMATETFAGVEHHGLPEEMLP